MNALLVLVPLLLQQGSPSASPAPASGTTPPTAAPVAAAPQEFHGRGVFYPDASTPCTPVNLGTRSDHACMRISLDDEHSTAVLDRAKHRILLRNDGTYPHEEIVGDVILPGWSESPRGKTPVAVHMVLRKKGTTLSTKVYAHVVSREKPTRVEVEPLDVVVSDGKTETVVVNDEIAKKTVLDPGVAARLAGFFTEVTDNLAEPSAKEDPKPVGDITISIGVGPAAKKALRAQLFRSGADAELKLTALSGLIPKYVLQRDLFLYGIELPALAEVKKRGLKSGEVLDIALRGGKGTVTFGKVSADLPDAANSMHDFLETAYVGMVLASQAQPASSK